MTIETDLHLHTVASGHAFGTITEMARAAGLQGLSLIAITDHGPAMPGGTHRYYFGNLEVLPPVIEGVRVLKGIEANAVNRAGELDLVERYLTKLDVVAAGLHSDCLDPGSVEENTQVMLGMMAGGLVDIIVHPGNPRFPIDHDRFVLAAAEHNIAIEINNSSLYLPHRRGSEGNCREIAKKAVAAAVQLTLGSDAHSPWQVGRLDRALALAVESGAAEDDILNFSAEKTLRFLSDRRKMRRRGGRK